jgi:hypothetical protein
MSYYISSKKVSLDDLQRRIEETDLVPSRSSLLENIKDKFRALKSHGIATFEDLRKELKNSKKIPSFSEKTGIDEKYLKLLRREIEGYFPKAIPLKSFDWLPEKELSKLEKKGYKNSALLFEALNSSEKREKIINTLEIDADFIDNIYSLVNLTRIQWVNHTVARMLVSAGYTNVKMVAEANAEELCDKLDRENKVNEYFKGKIGLRDIKRLVKAATYVR